MIISAPSSEPLVGWFHQSLLGRGSRHCHGIIALTDSYQPGADKLFSSGLSGVSFWSCWGGRWTVGDRAHIVPIPGTHLYGERYGDVGTTVLRQREADNWSAQAVNAYYCVFLPIRARSMSSTK